MSKGWLFEVEITGFPRTSRREPVEVYGGHREWWAVVADDIEQAGELITTKVYTKNKLDRELAPDEVVGWRLLPGVPEHIYGW